MSAKSEKFWDLLIRVWGMGMIVCILIAVLTLIIINNPALGIAICITLVLSAGAVAVHVWGRP